MSGVSTAGTLDWYEGELPRMAFCLASNASRQLYCEATFERGSRGKAATAAWSSSRTANRTGGLVGDRVLGEGELEVEGAVELTGAGGESGEVE